MDVTELFRTIHPIWIQRLTISLAKGASVREDLRAQLQRFYELLVQAIDTGDPAWLDSILALWSTSMTLTDLESGESSLTAFIKEIMLQTHQICRESLSDDQALELTTALIPAFAFAFERAAFYEMQARVSYISKQLKTAQQTLEKLDRSKSDFIAVAAHELKTPLTLIEGYTAMLHEAREQKDGLSPLETELLGGIHSGTRRLKAIIEDMIDVSLIDNNLLQLNFQPVWINRLLEMLKTELEPATRERCQIFELHDFPGLNEMTFGDPERLFQVLRNMLTNAIKYTPDGGSIIIDGRKLPGFLELIIHDTGIGIDPEDQGIIFEKFTRLGSISLHSSGKTKFKGGGPGLGLHIAKGIVEAHGGTIWAESPGYDEEKFPGSTFHLLLPMLREPPDSRMARLLSPLFTNQMTEENTQ
jgi:signal transduction histidine kinase